MHAYPHSEYYRDRSSEYELCNDFPLDRMFIEGLHAMQAHMWNNGVNLDIPVVRVMNTAHFLAAYMFANSCDGDQLEYDALANMSLGRDKQMFKVAIIVLAAMLARTEGFRARQCRNMLLEDRDPDFEEGVTIYNRFLKSAQERFEEEDFLMDTSSLIAQLKEKEETITQQSQTIRQLQQTITTMEEKYTQINIGTQNNNCTINNITYVMPATQSEPQDITPEQGHEYFKHLTQKCIDEKRVEAVEAEIKAACKGTAEGLWRTLWNNENLGYVVVAPIDATTLYRDIENRFGNLPFKERQFRSARNKR